MKKIIIILALFAFSFNLFAQSDSVSRKEIVPYLSASLSTSTGNNFKLNTFYSVEAGICIENLMFGLASGRSNLDYSSDNIQNYWYELKGYVSMPLGSVKGFVLVGWGQYYKTTNSFIEYGLGASYSIKNIDFSLTVSNWDKIVYVTPGICLNFPKKKK